MTNFAKAFAGVLSGGQDKRDARAERSAVVFGHSLMDAHIIDDVVQRGIMEAGRVVGAALDNLPPLLQADAMAMMLSRVAYNMAVLEEEVARVVLGANKPTPGCDCDACKNIEFLRTQLTEAENNIQSAYREQNNEKG